VESLLAAAHELLQKNTESVEYGGTTWRYSVPSRSTYPHQWLWDSCFHATIWSLFDLPRACDELRSILLWQHEDGLIPHIVFWHSESLPRRFWHHLESTDAWSFTRSERPKTTVLTQPPVLASTVERLVLAGAEDFLAETLPRLERYYRYLATNRDPDSDGLISTICQFETGLDYSPAYDQSLGVRFDQPLRISMAVRRVKLANKLTGYDLERIFASERHVEDVLVNTIWIDNLKALARLARRADEKELASWAEAKAVQALQSLLERSWDANRGLFFNLDGSEEKRPDVKTIQCLMPLLLDDLAPEMVERLLEHLTDPKEFGAPYPVPSVALDEPSYSDGCNFGRTRLIWRGPFSMNTNWFLWQGLLRHREPGLASHLVERSLSVVERSGFNEFFSAESGDPLGADHFGWATLAADMEVTGKARSSLS
jgi:Glycogen debranching enzyme